MTTIDGPRAELSAADGALARYAAAGYVPLTARRGMATANGHTAALSYAQQSIQLRIGAAIVAQMGRPERAHVRVNPALRSFVLLPAHEDGPDVIRLSRATGYRSETRQIGMANILRSMGLPVAKGPIGPSLAVPLRWGDGALVIGPLPPLPGEEVQP